MAVMDVSGTCGNAQREHPPAPILALCSIGALTGLNGGMSTAAAQDSSTSRAQARCVPTLAKNFTMHADLHHFLSRLIGTTLVALAPVVFTAFVSMPLSLNRHPGDLLEVNVAARHMT
jgi:hypothetical protein